MGRFNNLFGNPQIAFSVFSLWVIVFVVILEFMGAFSDKFMHFGPSNDPKTQTEFLGTKVDTWGKVITLYVLGFFTVCFSTYYNNIVGNWLTNSVKDQKTETLEETKGWSYLMANVDPLLGWINGILGFFVTLTLQLQFIIPQALGEILITILSTNNFLSKKKGFGATSKPNNYVEFNNIDVVDGL